MRRIPFEAWLAGLVIIVHLYVALLPPNSLMAWFHSDDAFYYFKTAQNISEGHGITFDRLGRDSGFHPLWMVVVTPIFALARFDLILPLRLVVVLSALLSAATAVLIYRLAKRVLHPYAAAFTAIFWVFFPLIHDSVTEMGLESGLSAFFIALLVYRLALENDSQQPDPRRWLVTGSIAALTVLARLDNVFLVLVAGAWLVFKPVKLRYLLVTDIMLIGLGVILSYFIRVGLGPQSAQSALSSYWMVAAALAVRIGLYYLSGLYRPASEHRSLLSQLVRGTAVSILASGILTGVMLGLFALKLFPSFPRLVLVYEGLFALAAVVITRVLAARLTHTDPPDEPLQWAATLTRLGCFFAPIGIVLIAYMGYSLWYFGTPMPVSGQIKRWWGTLPNPIYGHPASTVVELLGFFNKGPWDLFRRVAAFPALVPEVLRLLVYGGLAGLVLWRSPARLQLRKTIHHLALFPLLAGGFLQLISYTGTGYLHMRSWYWVSHMLLITLLLGILVDAALRWAHSTTSGRVRLAVSRRLDIALVAGLCVLVVVLGIADMVHRMPMRISAERAGIYLQEIRALEASTEPGARIGSTGGGTTAYFINDRTIVNLDGLMNTHEYFKLLQQGHASQYLDAIGLQYIFATEYVITNSDPYFQFEDHIEKVDMLGEAALFRWIPSGE